MSPLIPDTSTILNHPSVLKKEDVVIPYCVLKELDALKKQNGSVSYKARKATCQILQNGIPCRDFAPFDQAQTTDDRLIEIGKQDDTQVLTNDLLLHLKGQAQNSNVITFRYEPDEIYEGVMQKNLSKEAIDELYNHKCVPADGQSMELYPNQFLDAKDVIVRYYDGALHMLDWDTHLSTLPHKLNRRQKMAVDLLLDSKVTIVSLVGQAGTGKTSLAIGSAIHHLRQGNYQKLILSAPKIQRGTQQEKVGYLPGNLNEKLQPWIEPFRDNLHTQLTYEWEVLPLSMIQGRNLQNSIWIVTEAQNVPANELDQIIERVGNNSKLILEGDINQKTIGQHTLDGLTVAINILKDEPLTGSVKLTKVERSETAKLGGKIRKNLT